MGHSFTFAGKHLETDFNLKATDIVRPLGPEQKVLSEKIPGRRGEVAIGLEEGPLEIAIPFYHKAPTLVNLRSVMRQVRAWLHNGGQLGTLEFDDEPGKTYQARLSGLVDLEETGPLSMGEITFYIPDPDAVGATASQRIAGLGAGDLDSTEDDWASGTLTDVTHETVNGQTDLILAKYISGNWSSNILTAWELGTMAGMMEVLNEKITLSRGAGATLNRDTTAEWDGGTKTNTDGIDDTLVLTNVPALLVRDDMSAWKTQGWSDSYFTSTRKGSVTQQSGYMRVTKTATGLNSTVMVMRNSSYQVSDRSNLLYIKTDTAQCRWQFVDNGKLFYVYLPNTNNAWKWYRIDYATNSATLYALGSSTVLYTASGVTTSAQDRYGFILGDDELGTVEVSAVYYGSTAALPVVTTAQLSGTAVYSLSLANVGTPGASSIVYDWNAKSAISTGHSVEIRTRTTKSGQTPSAWSAPLTDGAAIPGISGNTWTTGDTLEVEVKLITTDLGFSPEMVNLIADIPSTYVASGTWKRTYSGMGIARMVDSLVEFDAVTPTGTALECWIKWTINSVVYGPYRVYNGDPLPYVTKDMDISSASFEVEFRASTTNSEVTPEVDRLYIEITPGYKTDVDGERVHPGQSIGAVGLVGASRVWWEENNPDLSKCELAVYAKATDADHLMAEPIPSSANGWSLPTGANVITSTDQDALKIEITTPPTTGTQYATATKTFPITEGKVYSFSADGMEAATATAAGQISFQWLNSTGGSLGYVSFSAVGTTDTFSQTMTQGHTAPTGATQARVMLQLAADVGENGAVWFKNALFQEGATADEFPEWRPCVNGGEIPGAEVGVDATGKTVHFKEVLRTSDPQLTPRLQMIGWEVSQETDTDLDNQGTANAQPLFYGTFSNAATYLEITHIQSGRKIHLEYAFKAGDYVEINCQDMFRPTINGSAREGQKAAAFNSRMIELHPGYNSFAVQPAGVGEFFCDWRERWL